MSMRTELEKVLSQMRYADETRSEAAEQDSICMNEDFLAKYGQELLVALMDAERWRKVRNAPLGIAGTPCVALPKGERSGDFINGEDADAAVDGMPSAASTTVTIAALRELMVPYEIAHNVCGPETEYARGYGECCGDIVQSINKAIDAAREGDKG